MPDIAAIVQSLGGMAQKRQLVRRGARDLDLTHAVRSGAVIRVRNGWYTTMKEGDPAVLAVRVGGRLTGISAVIAEGGWVERVHPLHVSLNKNSSRMRTPDNRYRRFSVEHPRGVELHWDDRELSTRGTATSVGTMDALTRVVLDEDLETAVAAIDWALHTGRIDRIDLERIFRDLPLDKQFVRDWVDRDCESLPESLSRTRLRLRGHYVISQVAMGDGREIDLVVDRTAAVEVDGEQFHLNRFDKDRRKDVDITINHLHSIRPTANMVFHEWPRVLLAIETALVDRNVPLGFGNSGIWPRQPPKIRGNRQARHHRRGRNPEFSKPAEGSGNSDGRTRG